MDRTAPGIGTDGSLSLEVPPEADQVRTARLFAAAVARHFGVDEDRVEDLKVAISEATTNSIKAQLGAAVSDPIRIAATPADGGLRFQVIDAGPGFPDAPPHGRDNDPVTPVPGLFEGSLGLTVIRSLFPGVQIDTNPERGITISFVLEVPTNGRV